MLFRSRVKMKTKANIRFMTPFLDFVNLLKFGKAGILRSCDTISSNQIPTLVMHGGNDMTVNVKNSPVGLKHRIAENLNARTVLYIMRNAGLDESQAGIKIAGRNINNLR